MAGVVGKFDRAGLLAMLRANLTTQTLGSYALEETHYPGARGMMASTNLAKAALRQVYACFSR